MNRNLARWRIAQRLTIGFGAVLTLLTMTALAASLGLVSALTTFQDYRAIARDTNLIGRLQANMLEARVGVKSFVIAGNDGAAATVQERLAKTREFVARAQAEIGDPERAKAVDEIDESVARYGTAFAELVVLRKDDLRLEGELVALGGDVTDALKGIMQVGAGDMTAASGVVAALATLLETRLAVQKYLTYRQPAIVRLAQDLSADALEASRGLLAGLGSVEARDLASQAIDGIVAYRDTLEQMAAIVEREDAIVDQGLDIIGPRIADLVESVKLDVKNEQDLLGPRAVAGVWTALVVALLVASASLALGIVMSRALARSIAEPMGKMTEAMDALAHDRLETEVPCGDLDDELGDMSRAVQVFKDNAVERRRLETERAERVKHMDDAIARFDHEVRNALGMVGNATEQLDAAAGSMVSAAGQASSNVQAVAAAAEQMSASVSDISHQAGNSRDVADEAVRTVDAASRVVVDLNETAQQITGIVDLITDIAAQTNLLALNATIEAARAGDMGRGFAVVAHEVKALAARTGQATAEISGKIEGIRRGSDQTVQMIGQINGVMSRIDEIATTIAGAVEEQTATTAAIARNAQEAAQGTEDVVETIRGAGDGGTNAGRVSMSGASRELSEQAAQLRARVHGFLDEIRAA
ncbi:MAG: methyl-accepting chemotaxis protein [Pseudomonadota bacterium]